MSVYPKPIKEVADLDYKLGIKSSLNKIASVIALTYALYKVNGKRSSLEYSEEYESDGITKIKLKESLSDKILDSYHGVSEETLNSNPLVNAQIEALQVGLQLIYKLAKVSFVESYPMSKERTGGSRFSKRLDFGTNIIILDTFLSAFPAEQVSKELANWLNNTPSMDGNPISMGIRKICAIFSEDVPSKIRISSGGEIVFKQQEVYEQILNGDHVTVTDAKENVGTLRIFNSIFKEDLHPYLENNNGLYVRDGESEALQEYSSMVDNTSAMLPKRTIINSIPTDSSGTAGSPAKPKLTFEFKFDPDPESESTKAMADIPQLNRLQVIYYGAPGTGKSHQTDKLVEKDKANKMHQRVTFHPDSDYSSFVGCYKPSKENGELTYKFVPQAFLKAYVAAWKNLDNPYYLIIEEINRGNCAQVFGDVFQLLDRRSDGFSKYHISTDTDIAAYLRDEAFAGIGEGERPMVPGIDTAQIFRGDIMQLPSNLHIYATMNTSDQSLFPIDSAFKRRWDWEYKPIERPADAEYRGWKIVTADGAAYDWWEFLSKVNDRIFDATQSEDKKMGYWFCKADSQKRITQDAFVGKVLFYLWNDVFKDYVRTDSTVFKVFTDVDKNETEEYTFTDFFRSEGVPDRIHRIMATLGVEREVWRDKNGVSDGHPEESAL